MKSEVMSPNAYIIVKFENVPKNWLTDKQMEPVTYPFLIIKPNINLSNDKGKWAGSYSSNSAFLLWALKAQSGTETQHASSI